MAIEVTMSEGYLLVRLIGTLTNDDLLSLGDQVLAIEAAARDAALDWLPRADARLG